MSRSGTLSTAPWNDQAVAVLKARFAAGDSFSAIARAVGGVSRSACIGKAARLGLSRSNDPAELCRQTTTLTNRLGLQAPPVERKPKVSNGLNFGAGAPKPPWPAGRRALAAFAIPQEGGVALAEVRAGHCRWPLGDPESDAFRFCGQPRTRGQYCERHASRGYAGKMTAEELELLARMAR